MSHIFWQNTAIPINPEGVLLQFFYGYYFKLKALFTNSAAMVGTKRIGPSYQSASRVSNSGGMDNGMNLIFWLTF